MVLHVAHGTCKAHGWAVDAGHEEALKHDLVELGVGTTGEEAVKLDEKLHVHILGGRLLAVLVPEALLVLLDRLVILSHGCSFRSRSGELIIMWRLGARHTKKWWWESFRRCVEYVLDSVEARERPRKPTGQQHQTKNARKGGGGGGLRHTRVYFVCVCVAVWPGCRGSADARMRGALLSYSIYSYLSYPFIPFHTFHTFQWLRGLRGLRVAGIPQSGRCGTLQ